MNNSENEQWRLEGNCSICRRKGYCKRNCRANRGSLDKFISETILEKTGLSPVITELFVKEQNDEH